MKSNNFIRAKLVNRTNADCSDDIVKNNRYHYLLRFEKSIGLDWLETQVHKTSVETETDLEIWKINPSGVNDFEVEVREVGRRADIDSSQHSLKAFEK